VTEAVVAPGRRVLVVYVQCTGWSRWCSRNGAWRSLREPTPGRPRAGGWRPCSRRPPTTGWPQLPVSRTAPRALLSNPVLTAHWPPRLQPAASRGLASWTLLVRCQTAEQRRAEQRASRGRGRSAVRCSVTRLVSEQPRTTTRVQSRRAQSVASLRPTPPSLYPWRSPADASSACSPSPCSSRSSAAAARRR